MIVNLAEIHRKHQKLLHLHELALDEAAAQGARFADEYTARTKLGFTPRSGARGLANATRGRVIRTAGGRIVKVSNLKRYAAAIDRGSKPHVIRPRKAKFLRFRVGGRLVFSRRVMHPGTRPTRFLWRTTYAAFRVTGPIAEKRLERIAREL